MARGNIHTADLGYLGFQDYHKKICSSVASKLREAMPPVTSHATALWKVIFVLPSLT